MASTDATGDEQAVASDEPQKNQSPQRNPDCNHGRMGASDYAGCPMVTLSHDRLQSGDACPDCLSHDTKAKLYAITPGILIRLEGKPLISGTRYAIEKLRCAVCGTVYMADVPEDIAQAPKYAPSCASNIALGRYWLGMPFHRLECWQAIQQVPVPDATQWDKVAALAKVIEPVYTLLQRLSAEGDCLFYDDTPNKILNLPDNQARKGVYTTAVVSQVEQYTVHLFFTTRCYASENIEPLLRGRESEATFATMCDASPMNIPHDMDKDLLARWILCFCLVHGRRKFFEIMPAFETACGFVLEPIGKVYKHERHCRDNHYTADDRLAYHQKHSAPYMEALRIWLTTQIVFGETEANSALGTAIRYMLRHWDALTRFLHVSGVPIDNSLAERTIKVAIRHRRNSLFFKTSHGAQVGDCLMSVIHTAARNGVNPFDYLNTLQIHAKDVAKDPALWLPWHDQYARDEAA